MALTPLIDVVFLLLVFFVLAGRFEQHNQLAVAQDGGNSPVVTAAQPKILRLLANGDARLGRNVVTADTVEEHLHGSKTLVLVPQHEVDVQRLVTWVDRLKALGVDDISFLSASTP